MSTLMKYDDEYINIAKNLVVALEVGNHNEANNLINSLTDSNESIIFQEIGKLTRELHDTLNGFDVGVDISDITNIGIPDAKKRLNFVIEKTQEAADITLNIVERYIPVCERLETETNILSCDWKSFTTKNMNAEEFRILAKKMTAYFNDNKETYNDIIKGMNEIIIAQGFQDITGQIIKKVITLVQDVEDKLISVIKITGQQKSDTDSKKELLEGPQVPGIATESDTLSGQDEVDDLLSSLGF